MLSAKPWRVEAIVRLLLAVFVCLFAGSLLVSWLHYVHPGAKPSACFFVLAGGALISLGATLGLLRKPFNLDNLMPRALILLLCFYSGLILGSWAQKLAGPPHAGISVGQMIIATVSFQGAALVLIAPFLKQHQTTWNEGFGFSNGWQQAIMFGVLMACIFMPIGRVLQWVSGEIMTHLSHFHIKPEEQQAVETLRIAKSWVDRLALGIVTILLAPLAEETLFRGILYPWIKQAGYPRIALWSTSLVFAAIHDNLNVFLPLLVLALLLTALYEKTNNLLAPITAHASFNAVNLVMLYIFEKQIGA